MRTLEDKIKDSTKGNLFVIDDLKEVIGYYKEYLRRLDVIMEEPLSKVFEQEFQGIEDKVRGYLTSMEILLGYKEKTMQDYNKFAKDFEEVKGKEYIELIKNL